jgi:predicted amidophosphoribosyltransferase
MICRECGKQFKNVDRCDECGKPLCPYCGKDFKSKTRVLWVCSDCFVKLMNEDNSFVKHVGDFWEEVFP